MDRSSPRPQDATLRPLDITKIQAGWKIVLTKDVREQLEKSGPSPRKSDKIVYYVNEVGDVVIRAVPRA